VPYTEPVVGDDVNNVGAIAIARMHAMIRENENPDFRFSRAACHPADRERGVAIGGA